MRTRFACAASAVALVAGLGAAGAGTAYREFGDRGRAQDVRRTVDVVMRDNAYEPQRIEVRAGETVRRTALTLAAASIAALPLVRFDFNPFHLRNQSAPAMAKPCLPDDRLAM